MNSNASVTVIITPRDRYTGIISCINNLYEVTKQPFHLKVLDLGYPQQIKDKICHLIETKPNAELIALGRVMPMQALARVRNTIITPYTMLLDNDSNVTPNWLPPLIEVAERDDVAIVNPVTLETEGVDEGASLRNHLFTNEIRILDVDGKNYLIEDKHFRRALPEELPEAISPSDMFELHGVLFNTKVLKTIELPDMVIREHIDIGIQIKQMGLKVYTQPKSIVIFDNLATRMTLSDMRFFFFRWSKKLTWQSSRLFEQRWGYNFYAEQAMYHWVFRRRIFLICRWLFLPISVANIVTRIAGKIKTTIKPVWDPISNPVSQSKNFFEVTQAEIVKENQQS